MSIIQTLSPTQQKAFLDRSRPANRATVNALVARGLLFGVGERYTDNGRWCLFEHARRHQKVSDFHPGDPVVYMQQLIGSIRPIRSVVVRTTAHYVLLEDWPGRVGSLHIAPIHLAHLAEVEAEGLPIDGYDPAVSFSSGHAVVRGAGLDDDGGGSADEQDGEQDGEPYAGDEDDDFEPYPDPEPRPEPFVYATGERASIGDKVRLVRGLLPPYTIVSSAIGVVTQVGQPGKPDSDTLTVEWSAAGAEPFTEFTADKLKLAERTEPEPDEPNLVELRLSDIRLDARFQTRLAMRDDVVEDYAEAMRDGAEFPPVLVYWSNDADYDARGKFLVDGFHRYRAAARAGRETILADVRLGGLMEALWASLAANATHGLRRSRADLQRVIYSALVHSNGERLSDREIARHVGCDHKTVGARRRALVQSGHIATYYPPTPDAAPGSGEIPQSAPARQLEPDELLSIDEAAARAPYYARYRELVAAHPGRLVLMKHSLWYMAWDESVEPIEAVLDYRAQAGTDQVIHRPSVSISDVALDETLALLTQAHYSLAVMERDGSVRLIEPDGAAELLASEEPVTPEAVASFAAGDGASERDNAPENAGRTEWRDARVLVDLAGRPRGIVTKYASQRFRAWRVLEPHKPQDFATHQAAVEWLEQAGMSSGGRR